MTQLTYPDGSVVDRTYTDRNQLAQVDYNSVLAASFVYDAGRRETSRTFGNNITTTRSYRADNLTATIDTPTVTSFTYAYDANKNKTAETIGGVMSGYGFSTGPTGYDSENRLTTFNRTDGAMNQSWNLSPVGDWTSFTQNTIVQNRTHGSTHELTAIDSGALLYDSKGNLTTNSNSQTYVWDFDNRMKQAVVPNGATGLEGTHAYSYDALGRRTTKSIDTNADGTPDQTTVFVCTTLPIQYSRNASQVLAEYAPGALPTSPDRKYAYAVYIDEPILLIDRTASGAIAAGADEFFYYHQNNLYSVAALTDSLGAITERYAYTAYGATTFLTPSGVPLATQTSTIGNRFTYTARRIDQETNLHYYRARYYDSASGRFVGRDPIGFSGGDVSVYAFVHANPMGRLDPSGKGFIDLYNKTFGIPINEMVGIDLTGSVVLPVGWTLALQAGFFPDSCEIGIYGIIPAIGAGKPKKGEIWPFFTEFPWGVDISVTLNGTGAVYNGTGIANANSWQGVFYGFTVGKTGVGVGFFMDPAGNWAGGSFGVGPGIGLGKTNPGFYTLLKSVTLPDCVCKALILAM